MFSSSDEKESRRSDFCETLETESIVGWLLSALVVIAWHFTLKEQIRWHGSATPATRAEISGAVSNGDLSLPVIFFPLHKHEQA